MVGGKVIEVIQMDGRVWIDVRDTVHPTDTCAIYVERTPDAERVMIGDSLWWQGREAYWTPQTREYEDKAIPRIGYSCVARPDV
jgi:hypothetical protein